MKTCSNCGLSLRQSEFHRSARSADGLQYNCKSCSRHAHDKWRRSNSAHVAREQASWSKRNPDRARAIRLKYKYGITPEYYAALYDSQKGACAICSSTCLPLVVDHDHASGAVRGLLCGPCNVGIGHMRDDPDRLLSAAKYLTASR